MLMSRTDARMIDAGIWPHAPRHRADSESHRPIRPTWWRTEAEPTDGAHHQFAPDLEMLPLHVRADACAAALARVERRRAVR